MPLWNRCDFNAVDVVPLTTARGWAHALAIWDYLRGKTMPWQPSARSGLGAPVSGGTLLWNGGIAVAWLGLACWRHTNSGRGNTWL